MLQLTFNLFGEILVQLQNVLSDAFPRDVEMSADLLVGLVRKKTGNLVTVVELEGHRGPDGTRGFFLAIVRVLHLSRMEER